ncbi:unnamed protein product [Ectocarpus sp. CCAP 1310/34]|nr:unnamed protein product [Ectocarpus sp. CCAP 1310/34]
MRRARRGLPGGLDIVLEGVVRGSTSKRQLESSILGHHRRSLRTFMKKVAPRRANKSWNTDCREEGGSFAMYGV